MKQSEIQVGTEYVIASSAREGGLYPIRRAVNDYVTITGIVRATGIKRDGDRRDGIEIELTGDAAEKAAYVINDRLDGNSFIIHPRQVIESTQAVVDREAQQKRDKQERERQYREQEAERGAQLDDATLAGLEREIHRDAGRALEKTREELTFVIERAQKMLREIEKGEMVKGYDEDTWGHELPYVHSLHASTFGNIDAQIADYNNKARMHNNFVYARQARMEAIH